MKAVLRAACNFRRDEQNMPNATSCAYIIDKRIQVQTEHYQTDRIKKDTCFYSCSGSDHRNPELAIGRCCPTSPAFEWLISEDCKMEGQEGGKETQRGRLQHYIYTCISTMAR